MSLTITDELEQQQPLEDSPHFSLCGVDWTALRKKLLLHGSRECDEQHLQTQIVNIEQQKKRLSKMCN